MGKGGNANSNTDVSTQIVSWEEVRKHTRKNDCWLVIDGYVYNVTNWSKRHPGGARILNHFAGQDATEAWGAMHNNKAYVSKFMKPLLVGKVEETDKDLVTEDFNHLRKTAEEKGWFRANPWFYIAHLGHIICLEALAYTILSWYGPGWTPFGVAVILMATAQAQAGWTQHDYGHQSVFNSSRANHLAHHFVIGFIKGASSRWWNHRHFLHHVKPNVLGKDPDVKLAPLFLVGEKVAKRWGQQKRGSLPYNFQHNYFWVFAMLLLPVYFPLDIKYFNIKRRQVLDLCLAAVFYTRFYILYRPLLGFGQFFAFYLLMRVLEGLWFTFVTQMNHIPMEVDKDHNRDWVSTQLVATCNADSSFFNDWFTGHLNYQIEHHLFPTMPRHNYGKVAPYVQSFCKSHRLPYISKPLSTAVADIFRSLEQSGDIWYRAYYE